MDSHATESSSLLGAGAFLFSTCLERTDLIEFHSQQSESSCTGWIECRRLNFYRREGIFFFFVLPLMVVVGYGKLMLQTLVLFGFYGLQHVLYIVRLLYLNMLNSQCGRKEINTLEYAADGRRLK
jgi:hypothetical protein